jgi:hypothetical protein
VDSKLPCRIVAITGHITNGGSCGEINQYEFMGVSRALLNQLSYAAQGNKDLEEALEAVLLTSCKIKLAPSKNNKKEKKQKRKKTKKEKTEKAKRSKKK